jgi:hypothetical protein
MAQVLSVWGHLLFLHVKILSLNVVQNGMECAHACPNVCLHASFCQQPGVTASAMSVCTPVSPGYHLGTV